MLQINVAQQLKAPIGPVRVYKVCDVVEIEGTDTPVEGEVKLFRTNRGIMVKGTLYTQVKLSCSRCLEQFTLPLTLSLEEEYLPTIDINTGAKLPKESDAFTIDEHHVIDLTEAIRQYIVTATPMKPLCREACAGLCSTCGHNLNEGDCGCPPQTIDPRWSVLRELVETKKIKTTKRQKGTK